MTEHDIMLFWEALDTQSTDRLLWLKSLCFTEKGADAIENIIQKKT